MSLWLVPCYCLGSSSFSVVEAARVAGGCLGSLTKGTVLSGLLFACMELSLYTFAA